MDWATVPLGLLVGLALGALGGGGSVLAVPSLVYVLGETPHQATTASLIIVLLSSLTGLVAHARRGKVRVRAGLWFAASAIVTSSAAGYLGRGLPDPVVLGGFAVVMLVAAISMWRSSTPDARSDAAGSHAGRRQAVAAGAGTGVLIGIFGVGGGFLVVPALVATAGFTMTEAVGTSLLVICATSLASLSTRVVGADIEWHVVAPFALSAAAATVAGRRVSDRFSGAQLQRAFAVVLVLLGGFVLVDQVIQ